MHPGCSTPWDRPIKDLIAGGHLADLNRDLRAGLAQDLPNAVAGNAAANREQVGDETIHSIAEIVDRLHHPFQVHGITAGIGRNADRLVYHISRWSG
jgi:hypothetical protein